MRIRTLLAGATLVFLAALTAAAANQNQSAKVERPRDPWVFRCVLDERPRVVVLALHKDLYVAYDTTDCSFYKAWRGDVKFDGAVYTTVHGPQPTSQGVEYVREPEDKPWTLLQAGTPKSNPSPRWLGYRFIGEGVHLRYSIEVGGQTIVIVEQPEVRMVGPEATFVRHLRVEGLPATVRLGVMLPVRDTSGHELRMIVNGRPMKLKPEDASKAVDMPLAESAPLEVVTYLPGSAADSAAPNKRQEP